ncbi:hypothetical protein ACTJIJ_09455 [Niabella sp. 22666]|uniref:hypothetical protein n=1 Tax=Niabella sp. 22666 TaxID=3453954 RepID=UPI003F8485FC
MKFYTYCILFIIAHLGGGCEKRPYVINLRSDYRGWVYLLKSSDKLTTSAFYPDTLGVFYIPEELFDSESSLQFMVDDSLVEPRLTHFFDHEYQDESGRKVFYLSFYFPVTTFYKEQKNYPYKGQQLPEFRYFYYSGLIRKERLSQ